MKTTLLDSLSVTAKDYPIKNFFLLSVLFFPPEMKFFFFLIE